MPSRSGRGDREEVRLSRFRRVRADERSDAKLESAFVKLAIPFQIVKGLAFFERKENKDVSAYLRLLVNPADNISLLRAVESRRAGLAKFRSITSPSRS